MRALNAGGCVELVEGVIQSWTCGANVSALQECTIAACQACAADFSAFQECTQRAPGVTSNCGVYWSMSQGGTCQLDVPQADRARCFVASNASLHDQFIGIASVFCAAPTAVDAGSLDDASD